MQVQMQRGYPQQLTPLYAQQPQPYFLQPGQFYTPGQPPPPGFQYCLQPVGYQQGGQPAAPMYAPLQGVSFPQKPPQYSSQPQPQWQMHPVHCAPSRTAQTLTLPHRPTKAICMLNTRTSITRTLSPPAAARSGVSRTAHRSSSRRRRSGSLLISRRKSRLSSPRTPTTATANDTHRARSCHVPSTVSIPHLALAGDLSAMS